MQIEFFCSQRREYPCEFFFNSIIFSLVQSFRRNPWISRFSPYRSMYRPSYDVQIQMRRNGSVSDRRLFMAKKRIKNEICMRYFWIRSPTVAKKRKILGFAYLELRVYAKFQVNRTTRSGSKIDRKPRKRG